MKIMIAVILVTALCGGIAGMAFAAPSRRLVIYDNLATEVAAPPAAFKPAAADSNGNAGGDLWVTLKDLTRSTRFALKPKGICRDELCFPIPKARKTSFLAKQGAVTWFNLSEFARLINQPVAFDEEQAAWYFGPRREAQNAFLSSLVAPNFTLPDANGKPRSLREFRGKKVLLLTWASW